MPRWPGFFLLCFMFFFRPGHAASMCEVRINNHGKQPARVVVRYDNDLRDEVTIHPQKSLFIDLYYSNYCHSSIKISIYKNHHDVLFRGTLMVNQIFDIEDLL